MAVKLFTALIVFSAASTIILLSFTDVYDFLNVADGIYQSIVCTDTGACIITNWKYWAAKENPGHLFLPNEKSTAAQKESFQASALTRNVSPNHIDQRLPNALVNNDKTSTTTVTFDPKLVVRCKMSPYINCFPPSTNTTVTPRMKNRTFNIAVLRRPVKRLGFSFEGCKYTNCVSHGKTVAEQTDAVVIHGTFLRDSFKPPHRWKHQMYGLALWESPVHTSSAFVRNKNSIWNKRFNMTISYRLDSDVFVPYSKLRFNPKPLDKRPDYYQIAMKKTKTAAWLVIHCGTHSGRDEYVHQMQKYIDVDIFGKCGQPCRQSNYSCLSDLSVNYKFYLAFENSLCTDYITEKFFRFFVPETYVIPVVRGGADYDKYFENFTYINAAHFKTAKDLALYLKDLAADVKTYSKYLEYKDLYEISGYGFRWSAACSLCEYLNTEEHVPRVNEWRWNMQHCHKLNDTL